MDGGRLEARLPTLWRRQAFAPGLASINASLEQDRPAAMPLGIHGQDGLAIFEEHGRGVAEILSGFPIYDDLAELFTIQIQGDQGRHRKQCQPHHAGIIPLGVAGEKESLKLGAAD